MTPALFLLMLLPVAVGYNTSSYGFNCLNQTAQSHSAHEQSQEDKSIETVSCFPNSNVEVDSTSLLEENAIRLELYDVALSGKGVRKAKKICHSIEGDPIPVYVTVKDGVIKVMHDYSKDRWGAGRFRFIPSFLKRRSYTVKRIDIGYFNEQMQFVVLKGHVPEGKKLLLRLKKGEYF